jgi:type IV pilus assembly protein PilB
MSRSGQPKVGDLLLARGLITTAELREALEEQKRTGRRVGKILCDAGKITSSDLVDALSERLGIPKISVQGLIADPEVVNTIPLALARKHRLLALFRVQGKLTVAMADPLDMVAIDEIRYKTGLTVNRVIATPEDIETGIAQFYTVSDSVEGFFGEVTAEGASGDGPPTTDDAPIVRLVDVLLAEAIKQKTSDIHIEPDADVLRVRFRVDGVLREEAQPPARLHNAMVARIKVMAGMDVSEKRLPQDGRFAMTAAERSVDLRVSTLPTVHGEKVVIRVLDQHGRDMSLVSTGLSETQLRLLQDELRATEGMVLVSGPTGSGKTSTLYAALKTIITPEKNIVTVEDPVEYVLPTVNQVQVHEKAGLSFPVCLRALMRQNPDIIMVGEIRDSATAQIAVRAAMTGHLVLSTIHTIDSAAAASRLADMGTESSLVATALRTVISQRLVRRLCPDCAQPVEPSTILQHQLGFDEGEDPGEWRRAVGCRKCRGIGYAGQVGIYEVMIVDETLRMLIADGHTASRLREHLNEIGFKDLRAEARRLVASGTTTAEEILRVIPRRSEVWEAVG